MNRRPISNASKVIAYLLASFGQMGVPASSTGKKSMLDIKTCQFMDLLLSFKPVSLLKCQKCTFSQYANTVPQRVSNQTCFNIAQICNVLSRKKMLLQRAMRCSYTRNLLLSGTVKGIHLHMKAVLPTLPSQRLLFSQKLKEHTSEAFFWTHNTDPEQNHCQHYYIRKQRMTET